jgi:hypothetical protein
VNEQLEDPNLTVVQRRGLWALKIKLRHSIAECGQLPTRTTLEIRAPERNLLTDFTTIAIDEDGNFHGVVDR